MLASERTSTIPAPNRRGGSGRGAVSGYRSLNSARNTLADGKKRKETRDLKSGGSRPRQGLWLKRFSKGSSKKDSAHADGGKHDDFIPQFGDDINAIKAADRRYATAKLNKEAKRKKKKGTITLHPRGWFSSSLSSPGGNGSNETMKASPTSMSHHARLQSQPAKERICGSLHSRVPRQPVDREPPAPMKATTKVSPAKIEPGKVGKMNEVQIVPEKQLKGKAHRTKARTLKSHTEETIQSHTKEIIRTDILSDNTSRPWDLCNNEPQPLSQQQGGRDCCNMTRPKPLPQPQQSRSIREDVDLYGAFTRDFLVAAPSPPPSSHHRNNKNQMIKMTEPTISRSCSIESMMTRDDSRLPSGYDSDVISRDTGEGDDDESISPLDNPLRDDISHYLCDSNNDNNKHFLTSERGHRSLVDFSRPALPGVGYNQLLNQLWHQQQLGGRNESQGNDWWGDDHDAGAREVIAAMLWDAPNEPPKKQEALAQMSPTRPQSQPPLQGQTQQTHAWKDQKDQDPNRNQDEQHTKQPPGQRSQEEHKPPLFRERVRVRGQHDQQESPKRERKYPPEQIRVRRNSTGSVISMLEMGASASVPSINSRGHGGGTRRGTGMVDVTNAAVPRPSRLMQLQ